jgi:anthranilate phosphoribosyltransferase
MSEHAFAPYVRILGKGQKASRSLTYQESIAAMEMILQEKVEAVQLGAFLMLLRIKEESAEELAGFTQAVRNQLHKQYPNKNPLADIDWPSYAGKRQGAHYYILSMILLAENGIRVLCHGAQGHTEGRIYSQQIFSELGFPVATSLDDAREKVAKKNISYLPLENYCPELHRIINLRNLFGLRSPVHSFAKLINPGQCPSLFIPTFHPSYKPIHQEACNLLAEKNIMVFKGESGEAERRPSAILSIDRIKDGINQTEKWPALLDQKIESSQQASSAQLVELWRNCDINTQQKNIDEQILYAEQAIIGTCAMVLALHKKAGNPEQANELARDLWQNRNKKLL